jgi:hypothetical protein
MAAEGPLRRAASPWQPREEGAFLLAAVAWSAARLRGSLAALGVDPVRFRELLCVRVRITQRATSSSTKAWSSAGTALAVVMTWFLGLLSGLTALLTHDAELWVTASLGIAMLMLALLLFQVLAGILVDPTDIGVVAPHPIEDRTIFAVRLAEVAVYVLVFMLAFTAGSALLALFAVPPLAVILVYPLLALLAGATTLGLVTLLFAASLRLVGPTHFQRVALWLQIAGGVALFAALQGARFFPREQWRLWLETYEPLRFLVPPLTYARLFGFACGTEASFPLADGLAAVLVPALLLVVTFWLASRYFLAGLQGTLGAPVRAASWRGGGLERPLERLGAWLTRGEERAGFDFALALSRREPHLLRAVLPQLAMFQCMAIGSAFGMRRDLEYFLPASAAFLFMVLPNLLLQAQGTPAPEARVLFASAPLASEERLLRGGVKALLVQWVGVPALLLFALQLYVTGLGGLPSVVLAFELTFAATLVFTRFFALAMPFTRPIQAAGSNVANLGLILVLGFGMLGIGGAHLALSLHPVSFWAGIVGFGALLPLLWRRLDGLRPDGKARLLAPPPE